MANIQPYIDQILNAVYGEEVRSSIVNSIQITGGNYENP